jgi:GNAT superfamily N-acetyltransferase
MNEPITWHRPTVGDLQRTYDLIARCESADYGEPDTYLEDLQSDWSRIDLERDAWLALAPADDTSADEPSTDGPSAGDPVAYGAVSIHRQELEIHLYLDPSCQGLDLATALLARCEARGREIAEEQGRALTARTYVAHGNQRLAEVVTGAGFELANIHFQMEIRLARGDHRRVHGTHTRRRAGTGRPGDPPTGRKGLCPPRPQADEL